MGGCSNLFGRWCHWRHEAAIAALLLPVVFACCSCHVHFLLFIVIFHSNVNLSKPFSILTLEKCLSLILRGCNVLLVVVLVVGVQ